MRIVAAAILCRGVVFSGAHHAHIFDTIRKCAKFDDKITADMQGFLTDEDDFVSRNEAFRIAKAAGQITSAHLGYDVSDNVDYPLTSESLWMVQYSGVNKK